MSINESNFNPGWLNIVIQIFLFVFMAGVVYNKVSAYEAIFSSLSSKQDTIMNTQSQLFVLVERVQQQNIAQDKQQDYTNKRLDYLESLRK